MTRRQMYQRGEDQNKQTGFWGMIKSVTSTQTSSESILCAYIYNDNNYLLSYYRLYNSRYILLAEGDIVHDFHTSDLSLIQQEVDALEELSRQLFLETVDLQATKVTSVFVAQKYIFVTYVIGFHTVTSYKHKYLPILGTVTLLTCVK